MRLTRSHCLMLFAFLLFSGAAYLMIAEANPVMAQTTQGQLQEPTDDGPKGSHDAQGAGYYCVSAGFCFCHNQTECNAMISSGECVPNTIRYSKTGIQGEASCQWQQKD